MVTVHKLLGRPGRLPAEPGNSLSREGEQAGLSRVGLGGDGLTGPPAPLGHWACADSPAHAQKRRGVGGVGGARAGGWERERQSLAAPQKAVALGPEDLGERNVSALLGEDGSELP
ncbi:unnamed protein product [Rangifer tarandus platyrhynchus]|uniref:Uncharacterized protein n=1 Tax=Rangifer tarandus platyrhynchus TaxID=3082113 RepID=A0ABN8YT66_RANTA|nr:unnamed protein product [Rangifer tarandus platyrhynchus]